jgi:hypothetical protein
MMGFLKKIFGGSALDGDRLAASTDKADYALIDLLAHFTEPRTLHSAGERSRWSRVLPQSYDDTIRLLEKQGWLDHQGDTYRVTPTGKPFVERYEARLRVEREAVLPAVRQALKAKDTGEALELRRAYEARFPLGEAGWTGPEPQLSHSALTRRILFMNHWLLDGLGPQTVDWLKLYAAEQHLWGATWRLPEAEIPDYVRSELATPQMDGSEAAYWKAYQMALYVENHETWQRCKGGDHVRRIEIAGADDEYTCESCRAVLGKEFLVARVPELPHRTCTSPRGCRCRYEPVLEHLEEA